MSGIEKLCWYVLAFIIGWYAVYGAIFIYLVLFNLLFG